MCILHLGENGLEKYRLTKKWEQFKIVLLFMDHPVVRYSSGCSHVCAVQEGVLCPFSRNSRFALCTDMLHIACNGFWMHYSDLFISYAMLYDYDKD